MDNLNGLGEGSVDGGERELPARVSGWLGEKQRKGARVRGEEGFVGKNAGEGRPRGLLIHAMGVSWSIVTDTVAGMAGAHAMHCIYMLKKTPILQSPLWQKSPNRV